MPFYFRFDLKYSFQKFSSPGKSNLNGQKQLRRILKWDCQVYLSAYSLTRENKEEKIELLPRLLQKIELNRVLVWITSDSKGERIMIGVCQLSQVK